MPRVALTLIFVWLCAASVGVGYWTWTKRQEVSTVVAVSDPVGPPITEFKLTERSGREFDSREMAGDVWVVSFFFSACPGSCFRLNQALSEVHADPRFGEAKFLSITCDPDNDDLATLKGYAERFGASPDRWNFCRGTLRDAAQIGRMYEVTVERQTHSDRAVLVDRKGAIRARYILTDPNQLELLKRVLAQCLAEPKEA